MCKSRKNRDNPKKDKTRLKVSKHTCFMSEVQLQGLLDRTKPSKDDEKVMDMTTIDGIRVSKYSIKAINITCRRRQCLPNEERCPKNFGAIQRQANN